MKKIITSMLAFFVMSLAAFAQSNLENDVFIKVMSSVYEVVVDKHEDKDIKYEKEIPFDRLSFNVRNDKYTPIGTAFLMDDGYFYTAAHVIGLNGVTVYDKYYIRDQEGDVYEIDTIYKYSNTRDFIKFSVKDYEIEKGSGLKVSSSKLKVNTSVFSVGNALGEGIIIRNGTYTSKTYEDLNGEWQWLRFTAAASPGNSGGPLINEKGEVLGIITMKSQNENLNYALPIAEAINAENKGILYSRYYYSLPNVLSEKFYYEWKHETKVPAKLSDIRAENTKAYAAEVEREVNDIRKEYEPLNPKGILRASGKEEITYYPYGDTFPITAYVTENGAWSMAQPKTSNVPLDNNGFVEYGELMDYSFSRIHRPDNVSLETLLKDPKLTTEYCLRAQNFSRIIGNEKIKITSLGNPVASEKYVDVWGRTWFINYFDVQFADSTMVTFTIPLPTGAFVMTETGSSSEIYTAITQDMKFVADCTIIRYGGKFKDWKEYMSLSKDLISLRSDQEKEISFACDDKTVRISTGFADLSLNKKDFPYDDEASLAVIVGLSEKNGKPVLENRQLITYTDSKKSGAKGFFLRRIPRPMDTALEKTISDWRSIVEKVGTLDGKPYNEDNDTYIDVRLLENGVSEKNAADSNWLYYMYIMIDGQNQDKKAKEFLNTIQKNLKLK